MRKLALIGAAVLVAACALAGNLKVHTFTPTGVGTGVTAVVQYKTGIHGTPVAWSFLGSTNMTVSVSTVEGYGMSIGGAREVVAAIACTNLNVAITNGLYLADDRLSASFYSAGDSNATATLKVLVMED